MLKTLMGNIVLLDLLVTRMENPILMANKDDSELSEQVKKTVDLLCKHLDNFYTLKEVSRTELYSSMAGKLEFIIEKNYDELIKPPKKK